MFTNMIPATKKESMHTQIKKFFELKQMKQKKSLNPEQHITHDQKQTEQQFTQLESDPRLIQTADEFYQSTENNHNIEQQNLQLQPLPIQCDINYLQEHFFRDIPSQDPEIRYYIDHLLTQTPLSSQIRSQIRENFAQYTHFKQNLLPRLPSPCTKTIELPQPQEKQGWKTLVLDLDETLIHCIDDLQDSSSGIGQLHDINLTPSPDSSPLLLQISLRPGIFEFLDEVSQLFELILFTASEKNYAIRAMDLINQNGSIDAVLSREDCLTLNHDEFIKDLSRLNRSDIIIVDNSLIAVRQTEALVPIIPYYGDQQDKQLKELLPYLKQLSEAENMGDLNREYFLWDKFIKAQTSNEYLREIRRVKNKNQDQ